MTINRKLARLKKEKRVLFENIEDYGNFILKNKDCISIVALDKYWYFYKRKSNRYIDYTYVNNNFNNTNSVLTKKSHTGSHNRISRNNISILKSILSNEFECINENDKNLSTFFINKKRFRLIADDFYLCYDSGPLRISTFSYSITFSKNDFISEDSVVNKYFMKIIPQEIIDITKNINISNANLKKCYKTQENLKNMIKKLPAEDRLLLELTER